MSGPTTAGGSVPGSPEHRSAVAARWAVGVLFLTNGLLLANVVPRYPDLVDRLDLSRFELGTAAGGYGAGALLLGLLAAPLVRRFGSARVALGAVVVASLNLAVVGASGTWWVLVAAMVLAGSVDAVADVAENTHGLRVERRLRRSVLNTMHAMWSVGAVTGGLMGSAAAALDVPVALHLALAGLLASGLALLAYRRLLPGPDRVADLAGAGDLSAGPAGAGARPGVDPAAGTTRARVRPSAARLLRGLTAVVLLGLVAATAQMMEEVTATWSALYLREDLMAGAGVAGLGFVALQGAQTVGRVLGDPAVTRWGDVAVARVGGLLSVLAMGCALLLPDRVGVVGTVVAFGLVGVGIGTVIPSAMRRADDLPGLRAGSGLTLVSTVLRSTLTVAPLLLGVLADAYGLVVALAAIPVSGAVLLLLSGVLRGPRATAEPAREDRAPV